VAVTKSDDSRLTKGEIYNNRAVVCEVNRYSVRTGNTDMTR